MKKKEKSEKSEFFCDVINCARCGSDHQQLKMKKMLKPIKIARSVWTHWALCPLSQDPILVREE